MTLTFLVQTSIRYHNNGSALLSWLYKSAGILEILTRVSWHTAVSKQNLPHLQHFTSGVIRPALEESRSLRAKTSNGNVMSNNSDENFCRLFLPNLDQQDKFHQHLAGRLKLEKCHQMQRKWYKCSSVMSTDTKTRQCTSAHSRKAVETKNKSTRVGLIGA